MNNRSVPVNTLLPHLVYRNVPEASTWLQRVFGFKQHYHYGDPIGGAQLFLGNAYIMIAGPRPGTQSPAQLGFGTQSLTIFVEDVDAHYAATKQAGAAIVEDLNETIYGEKQYAVTDLEGHRWLFSQHIQDLSPEDWGGTTVSP
jgi:uncharacterized glyoxalase superfamily protein PhnB